MVLFKHPCDVGAYIRPWVMRGAGTRHPAVLDQIPNGLSDPDHVAWEAAADASAGREGRRPRPRADERSYDDRTDQLSTGMHGPLGRRLLGGPHERRLVDLRSLRRGAEPADHPIGIH